MNGTPGHKHVGRPHVDDGIVDELAIRFICAGVKVVGELTPVERRIAIARMRAAGHSPKDMARRLGMTYRTVLRHLAALPSNPDLIGAR